MGIVQAALADLQRAKAPGDVLATLETILDKTTVRISEKKPGAGKQATKAKSQEALGAEIQKDTNALLALTGAHAALARRRVDVARLTKLAASAEALSGKMAEARAWWKGHLEEPPLPSNTPPSTRRRMPGPPSTGSSRTSRREHAVLQALLREASRTAK